MNSLLICGTLHRAKSQGYHCFKPPGPSIFSGRLVDSGLLLLSRFQIVDSAHITYQKATGPDALAAKGCSYIKVVLPNSQQMCHVFNTHHQSSYVGKGDNPNASHDAARKTQFLQLREFIAQKTTADLWPIILMGDFNVNALPTTADTSLPHNKQYLEMLENITPPGFQAVDVIFQKYGRHPITYSDIIADGNTTKPREPLLTVRDDHCQPQRLDYIFLLQRLASKTPELHLQVSEATVQPFYISLSNKIRFHQLSDHYGVALKAVVPL